MAQDPLQLDAIQIEPSSGDTITISRSDNGDLQFVDAIVTDGISLSRLTGMSGNANVLIVGSNSQYTSVQDAIDAVSATSSATNPHVILVTAGVYTEALTIEKDGINIIGIGYPEISLPGGSLDTITIQDSVSTSPKSLAISGCKISCAADNGSCVRIIGGEGSRLGEDQILLKDLQLQASGIGSRPLRANTMGNIVAEGGSWSDEATTFVELNEVASLRMVGLKSLSDVQITYQEWPAQPNTAITGYTIQNVSKIGNVLINMTGAAEARISGCPDVGNVTIGGDREAYIVSSIIGDLTLNVTTRCYVTASKTGALSGDGSISISGVTGSATMTDETIHDVVFDVAQVDTDYTVVVEIEPFWRVAGVHSKTENGFRIEFDAARTGNLRWHLLRS